MLDLTGLTSGYHGGEVLHGIDLTVRPGTVHAVCGHNGAGKTTLLHSVAGFVTPTGGTVHLDGTDLTGCAAHRVSRAGVGLVPQGRRVFASLTVAEHLRLSQRRAHRRTHPSGPPWSRKRVLALLPRLGDRLTHRGAQLSGGEQQMLALARALLGQPRVLLLDEPTEGLSPALATQLGDLIRTLADDGIGVLLASPAAATAASVADALTVLTSGHGTASFTGDQARAQPEALHTALALTLPNPAAASTGSVPRGAPGTGEVR